MSEQRAALAEALTRHRVVVTGDGHGWFTSCACGVQAPTSGLSPDEHRADVALALLGDLIDEAEFHIQQLTESRDRAERIAETAAPIPRDARVAAEPQRAKESNDA